MFSYSIFLFAHHAAVRLFNKLIFGGHKFLVCMCRFLLRKNVVV